MFSFANASQSIAEVLADGFKLYRLTVLKVVPLAGLSLFIGAIPTLSGLNVEAIQVGHAPNTAALVVLVLTLVLTLLAALAVSVVLMQSMYALALGRNDGWMNRLRLTMGKLGSVVAVFVFSTSLMVLGFMAFFFPGVFLSVLLLFSMPLVVLDNCGWVSAIKKSSQLVWGHWWNTFLVMLIPMLISVFLMTLITAIAKKNELLLTVMNVVVMSFFMPFFYALLLVQFNNLKLKQAAKVAETA